MSEDMYNLPCHIYGTAWKQAQTPDLVFEAIQAGYRAIDTAAQPRHYREDLVGEGVRQAIRNNIVTRKDLFIQTKFSHALLQDSDKSPYSLQVSVREQVEASIMSSMDNFRVDDDEPYLDMVLLHCPLPTLEQTLQAWEALEEFVPHCIRYLGISNVTLGQLDTLFKLVKVKPRVIQNRFYQITEYDSMLRLFCHRHNVQYQAYWVLKKNSNLLHSRSVVELSERAGVSQQAALFLMVQQLGEVAIIDGTTCRDHMHSTIKGLSMAWRWIKLAANQEKWLLLQQSFSESMKQILGQEHP